jgi:hypothetical protein
VQRGGFYGSYASELRSECRHTCIPSGRGENVGFRLVRPYHIHTTPPQIDFQQIQKEEIENLKRQIGGYNGKTSGSGGVPVVTPQHFL